VQLLSGRTLPDHDNRNVPRYLYRQWHRLIKLAGVREILRPHDFRRSAAEAVYAVTKDVRIAQALLGHQSIATTASYLGNRTTAADLAPVLAAAAKQRDELEKCSACQHLDACQAGHPYCELPFTPKGAV
jgi:integrase